MPQITEQYLNEARAYRKALNERGIRFGEADRLTEQKYPGSIDIINPHQSGGLTKAVGAVGDVVGKVAPALSLIPGVGAGVAALATAGGKIAGKLNDPGGLKGAKLFKEIVAPAAMTYAGGKLAQGGIFGGGPAPVPGATTGATRAVGDLAASGLDTAVSTATGGGGFLGGLPSLKGVGNFLLSDKGLKAAEIGLGAYGAYQEGRAMDRAADLQERGLTRQWDWEDSERRRRSAVASDILAKRAALRGGAM